MQLIGIAGKKGSGKTMLAKYLTSGNDQYIFSFADPIRSACHEMFNALLPFHAWNTLPKEEVIHALGKSRREIEQTLGTDWGRKMIHPDIWCIVMRANIAELSLDYDVNRIVIDDVRFENEATLVRSMGGIIIHLKRPSLAEVDPHESESGIGIHHGAWILTNNSSKEALCAKADRLMQKIGDCKQ